MYMSFVCVCVWVGASVCVCPLSSMITACFVERLHSLTLITADLNGPSRVKIDTERKAAAFQHQVPSMSVFVYVCVCGCDRAGEREC